jgi:hypothetical protein
MSTMQLEENPIDVINAVIDARVVNPHTGAYVSANEVLEYLKSFPWYQGIGDRVVHFQAFLRGDFS